MKTITKFWGIIAIGAVIAAGLSACSTLFAPAPPPSEEELALRDTLYNATWEKKELANQPSLTAFEKLLGGEEFSFFMSAATDDNPNSDGREIGVTRNGVRSTIKLIYMAPNTWYELRAPELPGITYYYYRRSGGALSITDVYKSTQ